jgi:hypothetical protein
MGVGGQRCDDSDIASVIRTCQYRPFCTVLGPKSANWGSISPLKLACSDQGCSRYGRQQATSVQVVAQLLTGRDTVCLLPWSPCLTLHISASPAPTVHRLFFPLRPLWIPDIQARGHKANKESKMRLINVKTLMREGFLDHEAPPYAIVSPTWGDPMKNLPSST